jgi:hypothetical protein
MFYSPTVYTKSVKLKVLLFPRPYVIPWPCCRSISIIKLRRTVFALVCLHISNHNFKLRISIS